MKQSLGEACLGVMKQMKWWKSRVRSGWQWAGAGLHDTPPTILLLLSVGRTEDAHSSCDLKAQALWPPSPLHLFEKPVPPHQIQCKALTRAQVWRQGLTWSCCTHQETCILCVHSVGIPRYQNILVWTPFSFSVFRCFLLILFWTKWS